MRYLFEHRLRPMAALTTILLTAFTGGNAIHAGQSFSLFDTGIDLAMLTPAGKLVMDAETRLPAVAPLTMNFVRSPDAEGPDRKGRFLLAINSGYGVEFTSKSKAQQSISVIDLNAMPEPVVVQTVYFPSPQSANFGAVFDPRLQMDGKYRFYVSGGFENKVWILGLDPKAAKPLTPAGKPDEKLNATSIDVSSFAENAPSPNYNRDVAAVYPTGIGVSPDGETLFTANNLSDSLGVVTDLRYTRHVAHYSLVRTGSSQFVYPYDLKLLTAGRVVSKIYVSLWGDGSVAVVNRNSRYNITHIQVGRHPTAMLMNKSQTRLFVVNSNSDSVSVIDTRTDRVAETIDLRLSETENIGSSPEGLALSEDESTLYVANAHSNAVAVVRLAIAGARSKLAGFIPTGKYPSAVYAVGNRLFIANGKGTGMENSSQIVNNTFLYPNMPNKAFPGDSYNKRGLYSVSIVSGDISTLEVPDERSLYAYTQSVMRNDGLVGGSSRQIFAGGRSPFKHVIYIIRENRTYDQVFGDVKTSGDGSKADGEASVAIFGEGDAAKSPNGPRQNITPNAHALAARFGLLDRFFVNAEASPDGHNWSTAAFSNDYVDKGFRWDYSGRGRTYDYEGFNRLPSYSSGQPPVALPSVFDLPATELDIAAFLKRYVPYLNGSRDIAEPETLYLWDAAKRAGLTYRNYGEYIASLSAEDVKEVNTRKSKRYPDLSPNVTAFATKQSLEGHFAPSARNFDLDTPDSFTVDSYRDHVAKGNSKSVDPAISNFNPDGSLHGNSRFGTWAEEFRLFVADRSAGRGDRMPNLSILRLSNDHTNGMKPRIPTPQFYVADNDYALGRVVVGSSRVDLQACKLEYSIVSPK